jgi:hypothetical protein
VEETRIIDLHSEKKRLRRALAEQASQSSPATPAAIIVICASSTEASTIYSTTMDITPVFNQALATHDARPIRPYEFRLQDLDEFVKEAYRIVGHVANQTSRHKTDSGSDRTLQTSINT